MGERIHRYVRLQRPLLLAAALWAAASCGSSGREADQSVTSTHDSLATTTVPGNDGPVSPVETTLPSSAVSFLCGGWAPWTFGLDVATGELEWTVCRNLPPAIVIGRSSGVTLLWQQDGYGNAETVALDDSGTERWRHDSTADRPQLLIGTTSVVSTSPDVEAIDVVDGRVRWSHPLAEGTPIGVGKGLVVEVAGGSPAAPETPAHPADAGTATLRALDEVTGEQRWTTPLAAVPTLPTDPYQRTVGNTVIALPSTSWGTDIFDLGTGMLLRTDDGVVVASGQWLMRIGPNTFTLQAASNADTAQVLPGVAGQPVSWLPDAEHAPSVDDLLTLRRTDQGVVAFDMIDATTGATLWTLDEGRPIADSREGVLVAVGTTLRLLDRRTGATTWEFASPSSSIDFPWAAFGDGVVLVVPENLGD